MIHRIRAALLVSIGLTATAFLSASSPVLPSPEPPAIGDLPGRWELELNFSGTDLDTGEKVKEKETSTNELTLPGGDVVQLRNIDTQEITLGRYQSGFLLVGDAETPVDGGSASSSASAYSIAISGNPGKLKGKGNGIEFSLSEGFTTSVKVKLTQLPVKK